MATLTVQSTSLAGLNPSYAAAAAGGDEFANNGTTVFHVKNGGGGAITVTIDDPNSDSPEAAESFDPDVAVSVPAAGERIIGPFASVRFNDANDKVQVTYSGVTTVTVAAINVPNS